MKRKVKAFIGHYGWVYCAELVLTFDEQLEDINEAHERFHSLAVNVLSRYLGWVRVSSRQESGRWHFHVLLAGDFRSNIRITREVAFWSNTVAGYHFGSKFEFGRIRNPEGIAIYYETNSREHWPKDRGRRFVAVSRSVRACMSTPDLVNENIARLMKEILDRKMTKRKMPATLTLPEDLEAPTGILRSGNAISESG